MKQFSFTQSQLDILFPLHVIVDKDLRIQTMSEEALRKFACIENDYFPNFFF